MHVREGVRPAVHVDMHEARALGWVRDREPGLLERLACRAVPRLLARFEVTAGLHPDPELAVLVQEHAARPHHDRGPRDMGRVRVLVERRVEPPDLHEHPRDRRALTLVHGVVRGEQAAHDRACVVSGYAVNVQRPWSMTVSPFWFSVRYTATPSSTTHIFTVSSSPG